MDPSPCVSSVSGGGSMFVCYIAKMVLILAFHNILSFSFHSFLQMRQQDILKMMFHFVIPHLVSIHLSQIILHYVKVSAATNSYELVSHSIICAPGLVIAPT